MHLFNALIRLSFQPQRERCEGFLKSVLFIVLGQAIGGLGRQGESGQHTQCPIGNRRYACNVGIGGL